MWVHIVEKDRYFIAIGIAVALALNLGAAVWLYRYVRGLPVTY